MANEERGGWAKSGATWRLDLGDTTVDVWACRPGVSAVLRIGLHDRSTNVVLSAEQWRGLCSLPALDDARSPEADDTSRPWVPDAPPDYPALHARVSELLREKDALSKRLAEAEAKAQRFAKEAEAQRVRADDEAAHKACALTALDRLTDDRDGWRAAWHEKAAAVERRCERVALVAGFASGGMAADTALRAADHVLAKLDAPADGQAAPDGSAAAEEVDRVVGMMQEAWDRDTPQAVCGAFEKALPALMALAGRLRGGS